LNKLAKEFGIKVEIEGGIVAGKHDASSNEPFESRSRAVEVLKKGGEIYGQRQGQEELIANERELRQAEKDGGKFDAFILGDVQPGTPIHTLDVPKEMQEKVKKKGFPLVSRGGTLGGMIGRNA